MLPILALFVFILALVLLWLANRQQKSTGLPQGQVIYADTNLWHRTEKSFYYSQLNLTGKPDYLVKQDQSTIPIEVKSTWAPASPHTGHLLQLAAYCLLVEQETGIRPPFGILNYQNRTFSIPYTSQLESELLDTLAEIRRKEVMDSVPRSHESKARCIRCGYRDICNQRLR
jgi:CRISPR-associated exonuclease Cas4